MLPKPCRLKKKSDFERLLKKGKSQSSGPLSIKFTDGLKEGNRFGFLVPKKNFRKATLRNKIRRKLREQIRQRLPLIRIGNDIIVIARPGIESQKSTEIGRQIEILLARTGLLK